ncbi:MAG: type II secretion system F family protein [Caulobacteraceae bacterium]
MHLPVVDPKAAFLVLIFAAVFLAGHSIIGLVRNGVVKRTVNRRLAVAERTGSLGELVLELRKQRGLTESGDKKSGWLTDLIVRSGLAYDPRRWALYIAALTVIAAGLAMILSHNLIVAALAAAAASTFVPLTVLKVIAGRRAKALGAQLPNALEVIVRSLEAGHPVPTAIALVGREMPDPVGSEFGMAADEIAYGATLERAVAHIADRCRHPDVDLFAATIRLQERSGGNLTGLLKMNASTIRDRFKMRLKIHAASSEGRASAMILTSAPFVVLGILEVLRPQFYGDVIHERGVQIGLAILGGWMFLGNLVMRRMIDMRI